MGKIPLVVPESSSGDAISALEMLYRREYDGMVRLAFTLLSNQQEAEEVVQDSFVEVAGRVDSLRSPGGYLRSVVVSRSRSVLRRRAVTRRHGATEPIGLSVEAETLWDVLSQLPEDERTAVVLRYYGGYRATEISSLLDVPPSTVRSHVRRALRSLRRELEE